MRLQHLPVSVWLCLCSCTEKRNCKRVTCLCACVTNTATSLLPSYTGEHKQDTTLCARQSAHRSQTSAVWSWPVCCVKVHFYWTVFELKTPLLLNPKAVCQLSVFFFFSSKIHRVVQSEFNTPGWDCYCRPALWHPEVSEEEISVEMTWSVTRRHTLCSHTCSPQWITSTLPVHFLEIKLKNPRCDPAAQQSFHSEIGAERGRSRIRRSNQGF